MDEQIQATSEQSLDADGWFEVNDFALWLHAQHDVGDIQREALARLERLVPHKSSMFDLAHHRPGMPLEFFSPVSTTMAPEVLDAYYQRYAATDYTVWSFDQHATGVYRDLDLVDARRRDATPIYREWMEPQGVYYGCGATLAEGGVPYGSVTLFREREAGEFTSRELHLLLEIAIHLAVRLHDLFPRGIDPSMERERDPMARLVATHDVNPREEEVLRLMLAGRTNAQMAADLFISESTVKKHVNALYHKLGVANRLQLTGLVAGLGGPTRATASHRERE